MSSPETLTELFFGAVQRFSTKQAALRYKKDGSWHDITHQELARRVKHAALGLMELGIEPGDRVAILSENCPEWAIADYACLTSRCADVPVYPSIPAAQVAYVLRDSGAKAVFVQDEGQFNKVTAHRDQLPDLKRIITFPSGIDGQDVLSIEELYQTGAAAESRYPDYESDAKSVGKDDLATLIYTSGTTGDPKGVMLTHNNIASNVVAALQVFDIGPEDSCISILPLSHSFERMAGHYTMFQAGATINYADGPEELVANMSEVNPTIALFVPRIYEKIYARVLENAVSGGALKRRIFFWARKNAESWADLTLDGKAIPSGLAIKKKIADRLVFSKLHARTGGNIRFFISGGASLAPDIARFFYAAGLTVLEGYGLTETSPVIAANPLEAPRIGTVGPPIPGVDARVAFDGELLVKGPNVMRGYYNKPDATSETIDGDGWLHTGDIAEIDGKGYVKITDRKKDILVTAGGKNIAPQPIENTIKLNKFVLNAVMLGDKRKFPVVLVVPELDAIRAWIKERGVRIGDDPLLEIPEVASKIEREVMGSLRDLASYEMPKKLILVEHDFTIESGELTPSLKVKRRVVEDKYEDLIEAVYQE